MSSIDLVAIGVLINSVGIIAVAVVLALMARRQRRTVDEVTELQGVMDLVLLSNGMPPAFADRYNVDFVIDPDHIPPPQEGPNGSPNHPHG